MERTASASATNTFTHHLGSNSCFYERAVRCAASANRANPSTAASRSATDQNLHDPNSWGGRSEEAKTDLAVFFATDFNSPENAEANACRYASSNDLYTFATDRTSVGCH